MNIRYFNLVPNFRGNKKKFFSQNYNFESIKKYFPKQKKKKFRIFIKRKMSQISAKERERDSRSHVNPEKNIQKSIQNTLHLIDIRFQNEKSQTEKKIQIKF